MTSGFSTHTKGLLITGLGVLIMTPDGLLVRLVSADPWTLLFWRGLLSAIGLTLGLLGSGGSILTVPILVYLHGRSRRQK